MNINTRVDKKFVLELEFNMAQLDGFMTELDGAINLFISEGGTAPDKLTELYNRASGVFYDEHA